MDMEHDGLKQQTPLNVNLGVKRNKESDDIALQPETCSEFGEDISKEEVKKLKPDIVTEKQNNKKFHKVWQSKNRGKGKNMPKPMFGAGFRPLVKADNFYINSSYNPGDTSFQINRKKPNKKKSTKELLKDWVEKEKQNNREVPRVPGLEKDYSICNQVVDLSRLKPTEFKTKKDEKGDIISDEHMGDGNKTSNGDPVAIKTSYAQMVDGVVRKPFNDKIMYYPPSTLPDGSKVIMVAPKIVHKAKEIYKNLLYGYFVGAEPTLGFVKFNLNRMWRTYGIQEINYNGSGIFLFKFKESKHMDTVLELGPWIVANIPLCLKRWEAGVNMSRAAPKTVPVWIVLKDLPLELWETESICRLASCIGNPLTFDKITKTKCSNVHDAGGFARILVEVGIDCEFQNHVQACYPSNGKSQQKVVNIAVEYQNKPDMCSHCQVFGHPWSKCKTRPRTEEELVVAKQDEEKQKLNKNEESTKVHTQVDDDGFIQVTHRKQKNSKGTNNSSNLSRGKQVYVATGPQNGPRQKPNNGPELDKRPTTQQNVAPMQVDGPTINQTALTSDPSSSNAPSHHTENSSKLKSSHTNSECPYTATKPQPNPLRNINPKVDMKELTNRFVLIDDMGGELPDPLYPKNTSTNTPKPAQTTKPSTPPSTTPNSAPPSKLTATLTNPHHQTSVPVVPNHQNLPHSDPSNTPKLKKVADLEKEVNREWIAKQQATLDKGVFGHLSNNQKGDILSYVHNRIIPPDDVIAKWIPTEKCYFKNMCSLNDFLEGYHAVEDIEEINGDIPEAENMEVEGGVVDEVAQEQDGTAKFMVEDLTDQTLSNLHAKKVMGHKPK
ncbi:hypothetical protein SSX86_032628 [Deinandra increscens subsp. villosa]|uniref:DUF4283 domain-containing protein n=1 Tax=Deinandra increscens subsp. villosa TaxID=3103831 RepID=A0AAP0C2N8_9ASTR